MTILFARPIFKGAIGFPFKSLNEFREKARDHRDDTGQLVTEYRMEYLAGANRQLFNDALQSAEVGENFLALWFEYLDHLDDDDGEAYAVRWLLRSKKYTLTRAIEEYEKVVVKRCTLLELVIDNLEDAEEIDYDKFALNLLLAGNIEEFEDVVILNADEF